MTQTNKIILNTALAVVVVGGIVYFALSNTPNTPPSSTTPPTAATPPVHTAGSPTVGTDAETHVSNTTAIVTGLVNPNGAQTSYWFEYGRQTSLGSKTNNQSIGSGFSTISTPGYITNLNPNTGYFFRLIAKNSFGTVTGMTYNFTTLPTGTPPQGNAPTTKTNAATGVTRTTANLNGTVNPNAAQTSYWFEYGDSDSLGTITAFQSTGNGSSNTDVAVSISGLQSSTKYFYRLNTQNQFGTVNGSIANFTTQGPAAPTSPSVSTTSASGITSSGAGMNGKVTPNGAETTYWFEYSRDSLLGSIIASSTKKNTIPSSADQKPVSEQINGLAANTRYYYRVVAQNSQGMVRGDIVNFTTTR